MVTPEKKHIYKTPAGTLYVVHSVSDEVIELSDLEAGGRLVQTKTVAVVLPKLITARTPEQFSKAVEDGKLIPLTMQNKMISAMNQPKTKAA